MSRLCLFFSLLLLCILTLTACAPAVGRDPFAYANEAFSLSVEGVYLPANDPQGSPRPFAATATVGEPRSQDPALRELSVTFTAPETLAGVTVTATLSPSLDGALTRGVAFTYPSDYGNVQATARGDELDGLLRFAEGWLPIGDVTDISPKAADGSYTIIRREGDRVAVFTFGSGSNFPVKVKITDERGTVEMTVQ